MPSRSPPALEPAYHSFGQPSRRAFLGWGYGWALLRSAAIGCWMGITPGGPTAASFMSYGIAKRLSPRRANFGKGVVLMMGFGVLGYLFKKLHYPLAPMVLAMVIGDKAEDAFRQSMLMSKGSLSIFFSNTLVTMLVFIGVALLVVPVIRQTIGKIVTRLGLLGRS
jgi:TctA family transporter